ncbi:YugN-like family protein [Anaerobacillus sp. MEB173]|uniref:YugN-like family protein n=1 Tax=Anaerobacillus sp. MEB173 TaxID=3383345 RepID=UPI003F9028A9
MIELPSKVENRQFKLIDLENKLKPLGYVIGGNWDYDHGYFDYQMEEKDTYLFLRLPFKAVEGELDQKGVIVELGRPFLLNHQYNNDQQTFTTDDDPLTNQFSAPLDPDDEFPNEWIATGKNLLNELEITILT